MLGIELRFPAGRYHANPWGRNVNEGEVEWPPSPYRLIRALIDAWKRRRPDWGVDRFRPIMHILSGTPCYCLPEATTAHIRTFQSSNKKDQTAKQLIFDAFVAVGKTDRVLLGLEKEPDGSTADDLDELLSELNFLGRSESWVKSALVELPHDIDWNCWPAGNGAETGVRDQSQVACLMPEAAFRNLALPDTCSWEDAACINTRELLSKGWNQPPAIQWSTYEMKPGLLNSLKPKQRRKGYNPVARCVRYALSSTVLPHVKETISFAERIRSHVMGIHRNVKGGDPGLVSSRFSGKDDSATPLQDHGHAFFLPLDEDNDNRIDHLLVRVKDPFSESELSALDRLRSVWQTGGRPDVDMILTEISEFAAFTRAKTWVSATPFVTARHYRKGRGTYEQWLTNEVLRECEFHNLPRPTNVNWIQWTLTGSHPVRWMQFMRGKKGERPFRGHGCILNFETPVAGPFSLGARCHFGLGLFQPLPDAV